MQARLNVLSSIVVMLLLGPTAALHSAARPPDRVATLIAQLGSRQEGNAVDELVAIGAPAVAPLLDSMRAGDRASGRACVPGAWSLPVTATCNS